jgi:hypothetical protein
VHDLSSPGSTFYSNKFGGVLEVDRQQEDRFVFIMLLIRNILTAILI